MTGGLESVIFWCFAEELCLCGADAEYYCDWPGCDAPMCPEHVVNVGDTDIHWCRGHIFDEPKPQTDS